MGGKSKYSSPGLANFFRGPVPKLSINFEEVLSRAPWNFEEQNKFLESVITIINYSIIVIIIAYYNYIINAKKQILSIIPLLLLLLRIIII